MDHFDRSALLQFHQQVELSGKKTTRWMMNENNEYE